MRNFFKKIYFLVILIYTAISTSAQVLSASLSLPPNIILINQWSFNGNYNDSQGSAHLNGGLNYGLTNDRFGNPNSALSLSLGYMNVPPGVYFNGSFTIIAWIKIVQTSLNYIFSVGNGQSNTVFLANWNGNQIYSNVYPKGGAIATGKTIPLNSWNHVAFTLDSAGTGSLYINGVFQVTGFMGMPDAVIRVNNTIGGNNFGQSNANAIYDDIKIYNGALNSTNILNDYLNSRVMPVVINQWSFNGKY